MVSDDFGIHDKGSKNHSETLDYDHQRIICRFEKEGKKCLALGQDIQFPCKQCQVIV